MEGAEEAVNGAAGEAVGGVIETIGQDAAAFPWFASILGYFVICGIMWVTVEGYKAWKKAQINKMPKNSTETFVNRKITKSDKYYLVKVWAISLFGGAVLGLGAGLIAKKLGWDWGIMLGMFSGLTNSLGMKVFRSFGDKVKDLLFGWLKRRFGGNGGEEKPEK